MKEENSIKGVVRQRYGRLATGQGCCEPGGRPGRADQSCGAGYSPEDLASLDPAVVSMGLGCGNPVALAELKPGEVVLDLGSGGGIDVFLAAKRVGPTGKAIGVDMTEEMLEQARRAAAAMGIANAEFRQGDIEALPLPDESVNMVISNCVINLAPDKPRVFREAFRVLKPGGRLLISDVVSNGPLPASLRRDPDTWTHCVGGALADQEYLEVIQAAGFQSVELTPKRDRAAPGEVYSVYVRAHKAGSRALGERHPPAEEPSLLSQRERALIAVGVARAGHSEAALRSCIEEARSLGWTEQAIHATLEIADGTKEVCARHSN